MACELVFPVGEGCALGYLMAISGITAFISGLGFSGFVKGRDTSESYNAAYCMTGIYGVCFFLISFV